MPPFAPSTVVALVGTGGSIILCPVFEVIFGGRDAATIYAVAQLIGNLIRVGFNETEISAIKNGLSNTVATTSFETFTTALLDGENPAAPLSPPATPVELIAY